MAILNEPNADIDLVVLDVMLPGMSGYAVCEQLRSRGSLIPVVMLTARTLVEDRIRGFNSGADVYLQKPFDLDLVNCNTHTSDLSYNYNVSCLCGYNASNIK